MMKILRRLDVVSVFFLSALLFAGCAKATTTPMRSAAARLPQPDRIIVHDFAVTAADVALDRGLGPRMMRDTGSGAQSEEEVHVGQAVTKALTDNLIRNLREHGLDAQRAAAAAPPGATTASIVGEFQRAGQGGRTVRTMIGLGLGSSEVRTRVQIYQGARPNVRLVAESATRTSGSLRPGMALMLPLAAGAGTLATTAVVAGGSAIASETFFATVEADAKRTAEAVVQRIGDSYQLQGWYWR